MDALFDTYAAALPRVRAWVDATFPRADGEPEAARARAVNAKALDLLRGLLPAASLSHMGIYATGQTYEQLILHLIGHPLPEARRYGELILAAIKAVMPSFVARVERPDRGGAWAGYLAERRAAGERWAARLGLQDADPADARPSVALTHVDGDEEQLLAALLFEAAGAERGADPRGGRRAGRRGARRAARRPRRRAREPPPPPRPRLRGAPLPLRDRLRLRRVPRPPAPPDAHRPVAGADARPRRRRARGGRRRRGGRRLRRGARALGRRVPPARRRRPRRRGALRALPRLPDPLRARHERARGDAPDRAALGRRGPPGLPRRRAPDARADRRAPPRRGGGDDARRHVAPSRGSSGSCPRCGRSRAGPRSRAESPAAAGGSNCGIEGSTERRGRPCCGSDRA